MEIILFVMSSNMTHHYRQVLLQVVKLIAYTMKGLIVFYMKVKKGQHTTRHYRHQYYNSKAKEENKKAKKAALEGID